jgi:CubicO group peptidase (beta-lactamase class C family)
MGAAVDNKAAVGDATDERFRALSERVVEEMKRLEVPGVALGVTHGDSEQMAGLGVTSIANPLPVNEDTLFQVGSTTKTVTGTIAMRLVEEGRLDLDEPVLTYLPEFRLGSEEIAGRVTLRHLFTHTGGWFGDYFDDLGPGDDALSRIVGKMVELPQVTPLGEVWSYNNAGFYLAGRIIEVVTGQPYEQVARSMVLEPLGMKTSFFFAAEAITYRVAIGHNNPYEDGKFELRIARPWALPRAANPVGGLNSTVRDQLRYARFHMGDGSAEDGARLLSADAMELMKTPHVAAADGQMFGITWFLREIDGTWVVRHGGATNGQMSAFVMVPAQKFAITVLTNADRGGELHQEIVKLALEQYAGLKQPDPDVIEVAEAGLTQYAALYTGDMADLRLYVKEGTLYLQDIPKLALPGAELEPPGPAMRLGVCGDDCVKVLDAPGKGTRGEFLRGPDGDIRWFRIWGRVFKYTKEE